MLEENNKEVNDILTDSIIGIANSMDEDDAIDFLLSYNSSNSKNRRSVIELLRKYKLELISKRKVNLWKRKYEKLNDYKSLSSIDRNSILHDNLSYIDIYLILKGEDVDFNTETYCYNPEFEDFIKYNYVVLNRSNYYHSENFDDAIDMWNEYVENYNESKYVKKLKKKEKTSVSHWTAGDLIGW